jgi:hypothetical protein
MLQQEDSVELRARCDSALREKIKAAAKRGRRPLSAEIAYRLQKSFEHDEKLGTAKSP